MRQRTHKIGFKIETYSFKDFLSYDPKKHHPWFWQLCGKNEIIDRDGNGWDIVFPEEDFEKARAKIIEIYNQRVEHYFERLKSFFLKQLEKSPTKERFLIQEIQSYKKLFFNEELDLNNINLGSGFLLEINRPQVNYLPASSPSEIIQFGIFENVSLSFSLESIKEIRRNFNSILVHGKVYQVNGHEEADKYVLTAPNNQHTEADNAFIEVEGLFKFYQWLTRVKFDRKTQDIILPKENKTNSLPQKVNLTLLDIWTEEGESGKEKYYNIINKLKKPYLNIKDLPFIRQDGEKLYWTKQPQKGWAQYAAGFFYFCIDNHFIPYESGKYYSRVFENTFNTKIDPKPFQSLLANQPDDFYLKPIQTILKD